MDYVFEAVGLCGVFGCGIFVGVAFMGFQLRHMFRRM